MKLMKTAIRSSLLLFLAILCVSCKEEWQVAKQTTMNDTRNRHIKGGRSELYKQATQLCPEKLSFKSDHSGTAQYSGGREEEFEIVSNDDGKVVVKAEGESVQYFRKDNEDGTISFRKARADFWITYEKVE